MTKAELVDAVAKSAKISKVAAGVAVYRGRILRLPLRSDELVPGV